MADNSTSNWYKPLEKHEDDLTISQVYFAMSERKQDFVQDAMRFAMGDNEILNHCDNAVIWSSFTENERLVALYLINEAILRKEKAFEMLDLWRILREPEEI